MRYRHLSNHAYPSKGIRKTDIQDYYLPSPLAARAGGPQRLQLGTAAVPLSAYRLVRCGRAS